MSYDKLFAQPEILPNQSDIKWTVNGTTTTFLNAATGSDSPALSGYVLNNSSSVVSAAVTFLVGTTTLTTLSLGIGNYQAFYVVGANTVQITTTGNATGELNVILNANPF